MEDGARITFGNRVAAVLMPPSKSWELRIVLWILAAIAAWWAVLALLPMPSRPIQLWIGNLVPFGLCLWFSYGLLRMNRWARIIAVVGLWLVILMTFGALGPFADADRAAAHLPLQSVTEKWIILACIAIPVLYVIHVLGKYKAEFAAKKLAERTQVGLS